MIAIIIWISSAIGCAVIANSKNRSAGGWFFLGLLLSLIALIIIACLPRRTELEVEADRRGVPVSQLEKKCPDCAETVKAEARICRFCGHRFDEDAPGIEENLHPSGDDPMLPEDYEIVRPGQSR